MTHFKKHTWIKHCLSTRYCLVLDSDQYVFLYLASGIGAVLAKMFGPFWDTQLTWHIYSNCMSFLAYIKSVFPEKLIFIRPMFGVAYIRTIVRNKFWVQQFIAFSVPGLDTCRYFINSFTKLTANFKFSKTSSDAIFTYQRMHLLIPSAKCWQRCWSHEVLLNHGLGRHC